MLDKYLKAVKAAFEMKVTDSRLYCSVKFN